MAAYHVWHPAYVIAEPLTLEAFITLGDSLFISRGTETFARAALEAMQLTVPLVAWHLEPIRTHYFNSYRGLSQDWQDAWDLAWRLRITVDPRSAPALPDPPEWGYFDLDATDGSFRPDDAPQHDRGWSCLLLADARETSTIDAAQRAVKREHTRAACLRGQAFARYPQLRCDIGYFPRAWYESGAPEAETTLQALVGAGASVRFNDLSRLRP